MSVLHLLLTQFNLGLYSTRAGQAPDPKAWMNHRIELFERYTVPSVLNQSERNFDWIVFADTNTPPVMIDKLKTLRWKGFNLFVIDAPTIGTFDTAVGAIKQWLNFDKIDRLITTRLDNDDMIHRHFIRAIQATAGCFAETSVLDTMIGYRLNIETSECVMISKKLSPFLSLYEVGRKKKVTCWAKQHTEMGSVAPVVPVNAKWIQTVHGRNLKNRMVPGVKVVWAEIKKDFGQ